MVLLLSASPSLSRSERQSDVAWFLLFWKANRQDSVFASGFRLRNVEIRWKLHGSRELAHAALPAMEATVLESLHFSLPGNGDCSTVRLDLDVLGRDARHLHSQH